MSQTQAFYPHQDYFIIGVGVASSTCLNRTTKKMESVPNTTLFPDDVIAVSGMNYGKSYYAGDKLQALLFNQASGSTATLSALHLNSDRAISSSTNYSYICNRTAQLGYFGNMPEVQVVSATYSKGASITCETTWHQNTQFTVNNLATPLVKDNTKTMRITYELWWD